MSFVPPNPPATATSILIADDNELNRQLLGMQLKRLALDAVTQTVTSGAEAIAAAQAKNYTLILMDVRMDTISGYQATQEIRRHERGSRTPIIAITANAGPDERQRCLAAGMDDILTKPIRLRGLAKALALWLAWPRGDTKETEAAPAATSLGVIDARGLERLRELERTAREDNLIKEVIADFLSRARMALAQVERLYAAAEAAQVPQMLFPLRVHSQNLGATHLAALAAALCDTQADAERAAYLQALKQELSAITPILERA